jgi:hypothetical protein
MRPEAQGAMIDIQVENAEVPTAREADTLLACVRALQMEVARLPVRDGRSPDAIIGYNEHSHLD